MKEADISKTIPSKHAGSGSEVFWLRPVMASMQPELGWII